MLPYLQQSLYWAVTILAVQVCARSVSFSHAESFTLCVLVNVIYNGSTVRHHFYINVVNQIVILLQQ